MTVNLPLVLVLAALAWLAVRFLGVRVWVVVALVLLGFLLSGTVLAPVLTALTELGVGAVNNP
ncbi:hypothetical protein [Streptomyces sp. GC420]|uniref:hypothetical protein n=1 Tax=Streptomyces sp. GC420 TaxID=2697568 RepID=UPI001414E332|nr:hypothetical protein [Streptomyces sp. GC420]NBM16720.1 hypothetical protein [Streptomyces sp. GC420]